MFGKGKVELLEQKTVDELRVDISQLRDGSHTKVYVKCTRCGEEYKREFRNLHQLHNCPTYRTIDDVRQKWCNRCQSFKPTTLFSNNSARHDGLNSRCMSCAQDQGATPARIERLRQKRNNFDGWLSLLFSKKKTECTKHGIPIDITIDYLLDQWDAQDGCCYYSRVKLEFNSIKINSAQLDRVVPSKGYTVGNVVWCSKGINNLKNDATVKELSDFLSAAKFDIPIRAEFMKLDEAAKMPERKKTTDAGIDVYALGDYTIDPHSVVTVRTGIALVVPHGYYYTIEGRSGFWKHGIVPCRGIIDATYSGEVMVAVNNLSNKPFEIKSGDRFAQFIMHRFVNVDIIEVAKIDESYSERGAAGHGSTGIK